MTLMEGAGTALEVLSEADCIELLTENTLGRLAFAIAGRPEIFPVNYAMYGDVIVLRTAPGTKLRLAPQRRVAFEIDGIDAAGMSAWSVVVKGIVEDITNRTDPFSIVRRGLTVHTLAPGDRSHSLAIYPAEISGRRFPYQA
jgi:nitroimidazol reductase NimA-like FMN-containing flavoprotein (pyridoxamine 5'-phosphate oxidase superfamily)